MNTHAPQQFDPAIRGNLSGGKYTPCALTPLQERLWTETKARVIHEAPAFAHVLFSMMNPDGRKLTAFFTRDVPIAATDGVTLFINPDRFFGPEFTIANRCFAVVHEILHNIFNHCDLIKALKTRNKVVFSDGTSLPYDHNTMNKAMDYVINALISDCGIGAFPACSLLDRSIATGHDSVLDTYRKVYDMDQDGGGRGKGPGGDGTSGGKNPAPGEPGGGFDEHLEPGADQPQRNEHEWRAAVAAGVATAKAQGKLPDALERALGEILEPQVDWREHIATLIARRVGTGSANWRKPDRRLMERGLYGPSKSGHGCGTVVVACDTSGSVSDKEVAMFYAELSGIVEDLQPERVVVMWCDARVHRIDEVEDAMDLSLMRKKPVGGGGGTSFVPVFDEVRKMGLSPDALVYLTDGLGGFPSVVPSYPVIWGSIYSKPDHYPFGDVVMVPKVGASQ
jgi:predicted metal-dependent peptidase